MALEKKTAAFPFLKGRNSTPGEKSEIVGELSEAKDLKCENTGELSTRYGFNKEGNDSPLIPGIQPAGSVTSGTTLITTEDETVILDGVNSFAKGKEDLWVNRGTVKACEYEESTLESSPIATSGKAALASCNGMDVSVWVEQPYGKDPYPNPTYRDDVFPNNSAADEYRLLPPAMYYKVTGRKTNSVIIPKTKIEDMNAILRSAGRWTVQGPAGTGASVEGPLETADAAFASAVSEAVDGNICILRNDGASPAMFNNYQQEANPVVYPEGSLPAVTASSIPTGEWLWRKWQYLRESSLFIDYSKGINSNYYQMKPQLFVSPDNNFVVLIYANGWNPALPDVTAYQTSGKWKLYYRTIDLSTGISTFSDANEFPSLDLEMDRVSPVWDADYCYDIVDHPAGTLGVAVVHETPPQGVQHAGADRHVLFSSYSFSLTAGVINVSRVQAEDLSTTIGLRLGDRKAVKASVTPQYFATWQTRLDKAALATDSSAASYNPIVSPLTLHGVNKWSNQGGDNKLGPDANNYMYLLVENDSKATGPHANNPTLLEKVITVDLTTQGGFTAIRSLFQLGIPYPINEQNVNELRLVDSSLARTSLPTDLQWLIVEVVKADSGDYFNDRTGTTSNPSWLVAARADVGVYAVLFSNVGIVSDGITNPSDPTEAYFAVSHSGQPTNDYLEDKQGRVCIINKFGRVVATWEPLRYSTTSDSSWFGTTDQAKFS